MVGIPSWFYVTARKGVGVGCVCVGVIRIFRDITPFFTRIFLPGILTVTYMYMFSVKGEMGLPKGHS